MENLPLEQIAQAVLDKIHSEIVMLLVLVLVVVILLYAMTLRSRKERLAHENAKYDKHIERERQIIDVITNVVTKNTEAISDLKATLESSRTSTSDSLVRIHDRIDGQYRNCAECGASLARLQATLDGIARAIQGGEPE